MAAARKREPAPAASALIGAVAIAVCATCEAIIGGLGPDPNIPESPYSAVGALIVPHGTYSGTLVTRSDVLTAAHVVGCWPKCEVLFRLNLDPDPESPANVTLRAVNVTLHPAYRGSVALNDVAIVRLAAPAPSVVRPIPAASEPLAAGATVTLVGYGARAERNVLPDRNVKRVARAQTTDSDAASYRFARDATPEGGTVAWGDSGGPALARDRKGSLVIAGVNTFTLLSGPQKDPATYTIGGGGVMIAPLGAWIMRTTARP